MGGWSERFIEVIEGTRYQLGFRLQAWQMYEPPAGYLFIAVDPLASSEDGDGKPLIVGVETSGDEIDPYDVSRSTLGEWAVTVALDDFGALGPISPGSQVELIVYEIGSSAVAERVLFGIVSTVERVTDALHRIRVRSPMALLGSRYTVSAEALAVAGDLADTQRNEVLSWSPADAQLLVDAVGGFRSETGDDGVIRVTPHPDNAAGTDAFYLRWNGTTGTAFDLPTGLGILGTTAIVLDDGRIHDVDEVLFVEDHPLQVAAKMLVSTGTGYNGPYDRLPETWGWGIPQEYVDIEDIEYWVYQSKPATGSDSWQVWTDERQDNPGDWLITLLASGGFYLTMRQGRLTARALVPVADRPGLAEVEITDDDLIEWVEIEAFDAASNVGAKTMRAVGPTVTGSYNEDVTQLPATRYTDVNVATYAHANEAQWVAEVAERVGPWRLRQSERRVGVFAGLRLAQLAPGSVVLVTVSGGGRLAPYDQRPALVTRVSPDWSGGVVQIAIVIQPTYAEPPGTTLYAP
ncbi:MAG: hypothetical protein ACO3UW_08845 [Candidatus Nanopelagicales bacterium]